MKKYLLLISIIVLLISACGSSVNQTNESANTLIEDTQYQCDGREYCSEMDSYEEAKYFLDNCPDVKMDGDNDGIPCEAQFNR